MSARSRSIRDTGPVRLDRYAVVDDVGRVINPMICEGQVHGALAQGIGQALLEEVVYDRSTGQLLTGSFADYAMPRADDLPAIAVDFHEMPATTNPLGIKGVGETGTVAAPATIVNAVLDALRPLGVDGYRNTGDAAAGVAGNRARTPLILFVTPGLVPGVHDLKT